MCFSPITSGEQELKLHVRETWGLVAFKRRQPPQVKPFPQWSLLETSQTDESTAIVVPRDTGVTQMTGSSLTCPRTSMPVFCSFFSSFSLCLFFNLFFLLSIRSCSHIAGISSLLCSIAVQTQASTQPHPNVSLLQF